MHCVSQTNYSGAFFYSAKDANTDQNWNMKKGLPRRGIGRMNHGQIHDSMFQEKIGTLDATFQVFPGKQAQMYGTNQKRN